MKQSFLVLRVWFIDAGRFWGVSGLQAAIRGKHKHRASPEHKARRPLVSGFRDRVRGTVSISPKADDLVSIKNLCCQDFLKHSS